MFYTKRKDFHYEFMSRRPKSQDQVCEGVNYSQGVGCPNPMAKL